MSFADSLDCVGVLARNVRTVRRVYGSSLSYVQYSFVLDISLDSLAVCDDRDPTAAPSSVREKSVQLLNSHLEHIGDNKLVGLRIGVPQVRLLQCA